MKIRNMEFDVNTVSVDFLTLTSYNIGALEEIRVKFLQLHGFVPLVNTGEKNINKQAIPTGCEVTTDVVQLQYTGDMYSISGTNTGFFGMGTQRNQAHAVFRVFGPFAEEALKLACECSDKVDLNCSRIDVQITTDYEPQNHDSFTNKAFELLASN